MTDPILSIENVSGGYGAADVVRNVSLSVPEGSILGLIGPNGSGKTTLLRLAGKALKPRAGRVRFRGRDISAVPLREFCREVAFVPQDIEVNFSFTVMELVLMGRIPHLRRLRSETALDVRIAEEALEETDSIHLREKMADELSAGERQRVVIARALAQQPRLLFLDEPTAHLDIGHQVQALDLLRRLNRERGLAIVMIQHDLNLAGAYCGRIALMNSGVLFKCGTPEEVLTKSNIESVYGTPVLVGENPSTKTPSVLLVPGGAG